MARCLKEAFPDNFCLLLGPVIAVADTSPQDNLFCRICPANPEVSQKEPIPPISRPLPPQC